MPRCSSPTVKEGSLSVQEPYTDPDSTKETHSTSAATTDTSALPYSRACFSVQEPYTDPDSTKETHSISVAITDTSALPYSRASAPLLM